MVPRSMEAMAPDTSRATKGVCFQTKAMTIPRQSRKLMAFSGDRAPVAMRMLFISPFLARNVRRIWPVTMKGMNIGQR
ncbi:hypothetical protein D3C87_1656210 [compost metagenome]